MNKTSIIIAVVSAFFVGSAQAQEYGESFILNHPLPSNQSIEYKASNFIQLENGFFSSPLSPNYAMMEIDPYFNPETPYGAPYWKPEDFSDQISDGRLGFYPMDFEVNENGAAVISMPLEFPEGINGMTPHLSLNYNSQGGNGILGLGWSLGGMSKISRVPYTYMYNDSCHAVTFSNADELSLDGVILRKGRKDGVNCYYPEIYDYSIVYPINGNIANGFRVLKKDGLVYTYDAKYYLQSQIETPIEWHLSRVEDPFGNYIQYDYLNVQDSGAFYPEKIRYTGHDGQSPKYEIRFEYIKDDRSDCPPKYFSRPDSQNNKNGYSRITKKIWSIQCHYDGHKIMQYTLNYNTLDWDIRALSSVEKSFFDHTGGKGSYNKLIPTEFVWKKTDYQLDFETAAEEISSGANYDAGNQWYQFTAFAARFEHDKISGQQKYEHDIVHLMKKDSGAKKHHLSAFRSGNTISESGQSYGFDAYDLNNINNEFSDGRSIVAFLPADTDGDGLNEIVCVYSHGGKMNISLIRYDSQRGFYSTVLKPNFGDAGGYAPNSFRIGDFNGDGLSDLFFIFNNHPNVLMSKAGNPLSIPANTDCGSNQNRRIEIGDFNGDKKDQIVILMKDPNPMAKLFRIVANSTGGFVMIQKSLPTEIAEYYYASPSNQCYRMCSGDFNGDGKKDLLLQCHQAWRFYFSQGNGAFTDAVLVSDPTYTLDDFVKVKEDNTNIPNFALVADLDDDGCDDISIIKVSQFDGPSLNIPNHTVPYRGAFRRDFLIRMSGNGGVGVRTKKNLRNYWESGSLISTDRCIDSIEYDATEAYSRTNPFLPIMGNHKGTSPTEIMCCHPRFRNGGLDIKLRNTGCLGNPPVRAINKIVTSLGATTEIEYRPVSYQFPQNYNIVKNDEGFVENDRDLTAVLPYNGYMNIVEKVMTEMDDYKASSSSSPKTFRKTRYHFSRPYYHTRGRGFLGFKRIWSRQQGQSNLDDIFCYQYFSLNQPHSIMVPEKTELWRFTSYTGNNLQTYQETSFEYDFQTYTNINNKLGQIPNDVFSPFLKETVTHRKEGSPIEYEKETVHKDGFGNVVKYEHKYGTSATSFPYYEIKDATYDDAVSANRWILGVPKTETLTQRLFGDASNVITRRTTYENNMNTGRHKEKCTEPGHEKQLMENYDYDAYGNLILTVKRGSGLSRTHHVTYSDDGRFAIATTNAIGHTTRYHYDEATGRLDSIDDPNRLVTRYRYDVLGNLVQTEHPSGVLEDKSMRWVGSPQSQTHHPDTPDFGCPVYFTYSKRSGEAESYVFYDQHNRKLREVSSTMDGMKIYVDYKYYGVSGLLRQVSNPYFHGTGETPQYSTYQYDRFGRNTRIDRADGSYMSKNYLSLTETTIGFDGQKTTTQYTNAGLVEFVISYDGISNTPVVALPFSYYGDGKVKTADAVTYRYDINRNPRAVTDPSLGEMIYDYNAFGELMHSTTPRNEADYTYDAIGRMVTRFDRDGQSYWYYDQGFKGVLSSTRYQPADGPATMETFVYDRLGNLTRQEQHIDGQAPLAFHYTYDALGRQSSITYPSGYKVKYQYNGKGFMERVKDAQTGEVLWQANTTDRWGNIFVTKKILLYSLMPLGILKMRNWLSPQLPRRMVSRRMDIWLLECLLR